MDERLLLVVEPAVVKLQAVHKPSRIVSEVSLTETEFMVIDPGAQCLPVDAVCGNIFQRVLDHTDKLFLLLHIGVLRDHGEDRLVHAVVVRAHDVFADTCIQKSFLKRRARSAQECIVKDLKCQIQLFVQRCSDHLIVGKISIIGNIFIACYGIFLYDLFHLCEWLLIPDLGVHIDLIESREIFFIQPSQLLFHVYISVKINIAVGRMIIFPVEIKELLIGKLRDHLRVSAGFICIGCIREKGIEDHTVQHTFG